MHHGGTLYGNIIFSQLITLVSIRAVDIAKFVYSRNYVFILLNILPRILHLFTNNWQMHLSMQKIKLLSLKLMLMVRENLWDLNTVFLGFLVRMSFSI